MVIAGQNTYTALVAENFPSLSVTFFFEVENQLMMIRHFWRNLASVILRVICVCIAGIRYKLRKWTLPFWTVQVDDL
jgi:hypothetical protein